MRRGIENRRNIIPSERSPPYKKGDAITFSIFSNTLMLPTE
jgi:hypothetical protein